MVRASLLGSSSISGEASAAALARLTGATGVDRTSLLMAFVATDISALFPDLEALSSKDGCSSVAAIDAAFDASFRDFDAALALHGALDRRTLIFPCKSLPAQGGGFQTFRLTR